MTENKALPTEGKFAATIKAAGDSGEFEAIMSAPSIDRDGEVVDKHAFLPLPEHITIDIDHGMSVEKTIGSGAPFYDGDVLKIKGSFASTPLGQMVRTLVKEGHVRTMSVAYRQAQYETDEMDGLPHLRKAELLNAAIVGIPANRDALITAVKDAKTAVDLQGSHDALVALGAVCKHAELTAAQLNTNVKEATTATSSTATDPEVKAAAPAAADPPAEVASALVELALAEASLAL